MFIVFPLQKVNVKRPTVKMAVTTAGDSVKFVWSLTRQQNFSC